MKRMPAVLRITISAMSLSVPLLAVAQTGSLPLKQGIYVEEHEQCKGAPNAAILSWDGFTFSGAHSSRCRSQIAHVEKNRYQVKLTCSARGDGSHGPEGHRLSRDL